MPDFNGPRVKSQKAWRDYMKSRGATRFRHDHRVGYTRAYDNNWKRIEGHWDLVNKNGWAPDLKEERKMSNFVELAKNQNATDFQTELQNVMSEKVAVALEARKAEVAANMFGIDVGE